MTKITETVYKVKIAFAQLASRYLILAAGEKCQGVSEGEKEMQQGSLSVANEFLVSNETVVLRRWERSKQKFGFIKRVDKG